MFALPERQAVSEEVPGHFRIAVGGHYSFVEKESGASVKLPIVPRYFSASQS